MKLPQHSVAYRNPPLAVLLRRRTTENSIMKHRHVWKFSKTLVFGLLCFALSAQLVFAARLPSPVAQAVGGQAPSSLSFFDLFRTAPGDMGENLSLVSVTVGKY